MQDLRNFAVMFGEDNVKYQYVQTTPIILYYHLP